MDQELECEIIRRDLKMVQSAWRKFSLGLDEKLLEEIHGAHPDDEIIPPEEFDELQMHADIGTCLHKAIELFDMAFPRNPAAEH